MTRLFGPEDLLTPAPARLRVFVAVACGAMAIAFSALLVWLIIAIIRKGDVDAGVAVTLPLAVAAIAGIFAVGAFRLALDRENSSALLLSRSLYISAGFFGLLALLAVIAAVVMRDYGHVNAVIGSLFLSLVSLGAGLNARKKERGNDTT